MDSKVGLVGILGTVIGVILGFLLNLVYDCFKHRFRIRRLKQALKDECRSLIKQIPQLIHIFQEIIKNLRKDKILPGESVHSLSTVYNSVIVEISPYLSLKERNVLHVIYERLRVGDEILENYMSILARELAEKFIQDPINLWISRMQDQIGSYNKVEELINSYLQGNPNDVFYLDSKGPEQILFK